jgi:OOP family OmpA-OmpF porin
MMKGFLLILVLTASGVSLAQPIKNASVDQLVEQLAGPEQPLTRSLRNLKPEPRSIDLVIQFDFDSAKLQESSKPLLDNLVTAMKTDRLMNIRFKVEGHTDAKGSENYNQNLSMRRAESVVTYMADKGIEKVRMESIGKGFSDLLYPDKPQAMENRRVRITTLQ